MRLASDCLACWHAFCADHFDEMDMLVMISLSQSRCTLREIEIYASIAFSQENKSPNIMLGPNSARVSSLTDLWTWAQDLC